VDDNLLMWPDMDRVARKYLLTGLEQQGITGVPVATRIPSPLPDWFIRCFALPGAEVCPRTQWVQIIVQVYGTEDEYCSTLARICAAVMRAAPEMEVDVYDSGEKLQLVSEPVEKNGPFPTDDPDLPDRSLYQVNITWTVQSQVFFP
jgi:hypothetical protein